MALVSIIIPCFNEQNTITGLLEAIEGQSWPKAQMEVIIADGMSTDATRQRIIEFRSKHPEMKITLVDNLRKNIPAALNNALRHSNGEIVIRLDAHSKPDYDYVQTCVHELQDGCGEMVGGVWQIKPGNASWIARSIACAAAHPLGVGDALYRYATQPAVVDTVPFGAYFRSLIQKVGYYDETLLTNEDYEFNTRIRAAGGRIWLNPAIRSDYYARSDLFALARQYWRYGYWKYQMLRRYSKSLRWRQALPPLFIFSLIILLFVSPIWELARILLGVELGLYGLILLLASLAPALRQKDLRLVFGISLAIATMHSAWGAGFLGSVVKSLSGWKPGNWDTSRL